MAASRLLALPQADQRLDLVQLPFASLDYLFDYAVKAIAIHHGQGHREYGILCDAFKLNGAWCYAVGPCEPEEDGECLYVKTWGW